jgi:hypothetical protein
LPAEDRTPTHGYEATREAARREAEEDWGKEKTLAMTTLTMRMMTLTNPGFSWPLQKKRPRLHQKRSGLQSFDKAAIITGE